MHYRQRQPFDRGSAGRDNPGVPAAPATVWWERRGQSRFGKDGPLNCCPLRPIDQLVDALVLLVMLTASMALAVMGARGLLVAVLHVMAHPPAPARIRWGRVVFGVAIFWFL